MWGQKNNKRQQKKKQNQPVQCSKKLLLAINCRWPHLAAVRQKRCLLATIVTGWLLLFAVALPALAHHCQSPWCFCLHSCNCCCFLLAVTIDCRIFLFAVLVAICTLCALPLLLLLLSSSPVSTTVNVAAQTLLFPTALPLRHDTVATALMVHCPKRWKSTISTVRKKLKRWH